MTDPTKPMGLMPYGRVPTIIRDIIRVESEPARSDMTPTKWRAAVEDRLASYTDQGYITRAYPGAVILHDAQGRAKVNVSVGGNPAPKPEGPMLTGASADPEPRYTQAALADEAGRLREENRTVLAENARLCREVERLERAAKGKVRR